MSDHKEPVQPAGQSHDLHESHDPHAVPHDAVHFHNHWKLYLAVGGILMLGTILTVAISYVHFGSHEMNILVGLLVASGKAGLVALIFMHLKEEKATIYQTLLITTIFVIGLFGLSVLAFKDHIHF